MKIFRDENIPNYGTWDRSNKQAKNKAGKTYVWRGVYTFKREPLTANAT